MRVEYSPSFVRLYKKLPDDIKDLAEIKEKLFRHAPFDQKLKTHKLSGKLGNYWALWINYRYRIVFSFVNKETVRFHSIGDHSIYK